MRSAKITFHDDRALEVFRVVVDAWRHRNNPTAPQTHLRGLCPPEESFRPQDIRVGSREHALYLFFQGVASRSGKTANDALGRVSKYAIESPWVIDPLAPSERHRSEESRQLIGKVLAFTDREPKRIDGWIAALDRLREDYAGDPRNIFLKHAIGVTKEERWEAREVVVRELCQFYGVQHKIAQLIMLWFQAVDWLPVNPAQVAAEQVFWERFRSVPAIPVDIWFLKLMKMMDLVSECPKSHRDLISRPVSDYIARVCLDHDLPCWDLAQGLWHIGARVHGRRPTKHTKVGTYCLGCPVDPYCVFLVQPDRQQTGRGTVGYETARNRFVQLRLNIF